MSLNFNGIKPNEADSHGDMYSTECIKNLIQQQNERKGLPETMKIIDDVKSAKEANLKLHCQHSVAFRYKKIRLAINNPEYEKEYKTWNEFINKSSNNEDAIKRGYFFVLDDADII